MVASERSLGLPGTDYRASRQVTEGAIRICPGELAFVALRNSSDRCTAPKNHPEF